MLIIKNSYLTEVNLGTVAASAQVNIGTINELLGRVIYGVQAFSVADIALSPNGQTVVSTAGLASCVLTLVEQDRQNVFLYPLSDLRAANVNGFQRAFRPGKYDLTRSFITMVVATNLVNNDRVCLNFYYE